MHAPFVPPPSLSRAEKCSAGDGHKGVVSHGERALDAALRRFPILIGWGRACRDAGALDDNALLWGAEPLRRDIIAEYRRVVGRA